MTIALTRPELDAMGAVVQALRECQYDGVTVQLHLGDLGWFWRLGTEARGGRTAVRGRPVPARLRRPRRRGGGGDRVVGRPGRPGRPGLREPMGVHREHRGRGHGRAITLAAAAALRELGSASTVVAPSPNAGGIATYVSAGFTRLADAHDLRRDA